MCNIWLSKEGLMHQKLLHNYLLCYALEIEGVTMATVTANSIFLSSAEHLKIKHFPLIINSTFILSSYNRPVVWHGYGLFHCSGLFVAVPLEMVQQSGKQSPISRELCINKSNSPRPKSVDLQPMVGWFSALG